MEPMTKLKRPSTHRVYMHYQNRDGYQISFLKPDLKTHLPLKLTFRTDPIGKILEMHECWGEDKSDAYRSQLLREMEMGRPGGIWLIVSEEQYQVLNSQRRRP
ncbi:hypothetical protein [Edaphobacter aggregans]|uniref:hypothetical protein n=1 Tax=Edaphobacter aggregans TaxID=570835 RepID=UPI0012FAA75B|nr:hypothetical protein [Edaphobacter aggregans]